MKKIFTADMLVPMYVSRFSCIGGDCEDTCCAGWQVDLDKESLLHYQSCFDPILRPLFTKYVKRTPNPAVSPKYGVMGLVDDSCRNCGLLSETKMCLIHERLGEKALSDTCATYPRKVQHFGDIHQMTLTLSCPEAARLALLAEDAFDFVGLEIAFRSEAISTVKPVSGVPVALMGDVWMSVIQILQTRDLPLSNRLEVVGLFCERLTILIQEQKQDAIPELLLSIDALMKNPAVAAPLARPKERPQMQAQIAVLFFGAAGWFQTPHQRRITTLVAKGLGVTEEGTLDPASMNRGHEEGLARLAPALASTPWLLEHFLVNEVLQEVFPWAGKSPQEHYATLLTRYVVVRAMLAGRAAAQEVLLTPDELAETVQVFSRLYLHSEEFRKNMTKALASAGWDRLEKLYALLLQPDA